jgi:hypothetical protein
MYYHCKEKLYVDPPWKLKGPPGGVALKWDKRLELAKYLLTRNFNDVFKDRNHSD